MSSDHSVTRWISPAKAGDQLAIAQICNRYRAELERLVKKRLPTRLRKVEDEQDIVNSAFYSFVKGVHQGRFPDLANRQNIRQILVTIALRKLGKYIRHSLTDKEGGGQIEGESHFRTSSSGGGIDQFPRHELSPDEIACAAEEMDRLLEILDSDTLRTIAILKFEDFTNEQIAEHLQCAPVTVARKLRIIRGIWERHQRQQNHGHGKG
jgi:DNA-directed RNA polymerase specialized sigma24 family protein